MNMQTLAAAILPREAQIEGRPMSLRTYFYMLRVVLFGADTTTIRWLLANGSFIWFLSLTLSPESMDRPAYVYMKAIAPAGVWAILFFMHFLGSYWRMLDPIARTKWALTINLMGWLLWFTSTVAVNIGVGKITPSLALEISMVFAAGWALYRTGVRREIVSA